MKALSVLFLSACTLFSGVNLEEIYNPSYSYSLPKPVLESFFSGKAFDNKLEYTEAQLEALHQDAREIYEKAISAPGLERERVAVLTAGAPGAGKTIKMLQDLRRQPRAFAYTDPDDVCLKEGMVRTYLKDLAKSDGSFEARKALYDFWRPGSNAIAHWVLANVIREGYPFYFGTTSTGPVTWKFFRFLKQQGYTIRVIHITAPDDVRWNSIKERDKQFVQTTEEDIREKGDLLFQRIDDTYLKHADRIEFCYRNAVNDDARLAAVWTRNPKEAVDHGVLTIFDLELYEFIKNHHNEVIKKLNRPELLWEDTVEASSEIVIN